MFINETPLKITTTTLKLRTVFFLNYIYVLCIYNVAIAAHVAGRALHSTEIGTSVLRTQLHDSQEGSPVAKRDMFKTNQ